MIKQVEMVFNSYIVQLFQSKPEIMRFLQNHERKQLVIKNCCEQIAKAECSNIKHRFDTAKWSTVICECVKLFASAALTNAEQKVLSRLERQRKVDDANKLNDIQAEFEHDQKVLERGRMQSFPGKPIVYES